MNYKLICVFTVPFVSFAVLCLSIEMKKSVRPIAFNYTVACSTGNTKLNDVTEGNITCQGNITW